MYSEPVSRQKICDALEISIDHIDQSLIQFNLKFQNLSQMKPPYCEVLNKKNVHEEKLIQETPDP